MGKATIKQNLGEGFYKVEIDRNSSFIDKEIERINKRITAADPIRKEILSKRKEQLEKLKQTTEKEMWCCDISPDLSGTVETIELDGEPRQINIAPKNPGFNKIPSGDLTPIAAMSPAQAALNFAIYPGWQKFKPTYRLARITKINVSNIDIEIIDKKSFYQNISINKNLELKNVKAKYMSCDSGAFDVGDLVVVEFEDQNFEKPVIIGFYENPKQCEAYVLVSTKSGDQAVLWDAITDDVIFEKEAKTSILEKLKKLPVGEPKLCIADGYKKFKDIPSKTQHFFLENSRGTINVLSGGGLVERYCVLVRNYLHRYFKELRTIDLKTPQLALKIKFQAFGEEFPKWKKGDKIMFYSYSNSEKITLSKVQSEEGVFYPEFVKANLLSEISSVWGGELFIPEPIAQEWTIHITQKESDLEFNPNPLRYYLSGSKTGIVENSLYGRFWGVFPITSDLTTAEINYYRRGKVKKNTYPIIENTKNYIKLNGQEYYPTPSLSISMGTEEITPLKTKYKQITGKTVPGNLFEIRKKTFRYHPLFSLFHDKNIDITRQWTLQGFNAIEIEPIYETIQAVTERDNVIEEREAYDVNTGLVFENDVFKSAVGRATKKDFSLFYDSFSYKNRQESFFSVLFNVNKVLNSLEWETFEKVNNYRMAHKLLPMITNINLYRAAKRQADDILTDIDYYTRLAEEKNYYLGHKGTDGSTPTDRVLAEGYQGQNIIGFHFALGGENWAMPKTENLNGNIDIVKKEGVDIISTKAVQAWINSPPHRENLVAPQNEEVGTASSISTDGKVVVICQVFSTVDLRPAAISPLPKLSEYIQNNFTWTNEESFLPDVYLV